MTPGPGFAGRAIDDPDLVRREYADASRLAARRRVWQEFAQRPHAEDVTLAAVLETDPRRVLEVGAGAGQLAARVAEAGARVIATDLTATMVSRAADRGLEALVADASRLPFPDHVFDVSLASAMLYHVGNVDGAIDELARVLRSGGRLVAMTFGAGHLREVWDLVDGPPVDLPFSAENGARRLERRFGRVETREGQARITFTNAGEVRSYVAASVTRSELADRVPSFEGPLIAHGHYAVFVAEEPR